MFVWFSGPLNAEEALSLQHALDHAHLMIEVFQREAVERNERNAKDRALAQIAIQHGRQAAFNMERALSSAIECFDSEAQERALAQTQIEQLQQKTVERERQATDHSATIDRLVRENAAILASMRKKFGEITENFVNYVIMFCKFSIVNSHFSH